MKRDKKGPRLPGNAHEVMGKSWANLPPFRQGHVRGIYMNLSLQQYNVRYTEREGGKQKRKSKERVLPVTEHTASYVKGNQ